MVLFQLAPQDSSQPAIGYYDILALVSQRLPTYSLSGRAVHDGNALRPLAGENTSRNRRGQRGLFLLVSLDSTDTPAVQTETREDTQWSTVFVARMESTAGCSMLPLRESMGTDHLPGLSPRPLIPRIKSLLREALEKISGQLIEAQENERTRIARELHDDICQRLALLSVELEQAHRSQNGSPTVPTKSLKEIQRHCAEIATDVQSMSHQLHSSKLDLLELMTALRGFCQEFSSQHEVRVEFMERNVPRNISKEISLCLFGSHRKLFKTP